MEYKEIIIEKKRNFVSPDFVVKDWGLLEPYYNDLLNRKINNLSQLEKLIFDMSELDAVLSRSEEHTSELQSH